MDVLSRTRPLALAAGPTAVAALALFFVALGVHGDDVRATSRGVLGVSANALALVSLLLLLVALGRLALRPALHERGLAAVLLAAAGTVLTAGGAWAQLVLLPVLAVEAPDIATGGAPLLTAAYVASFLVLGLGWLLVGLRLRADGTAAGLLLAGAAFAIAPLPTRWFLLAVAVSLLARREQRVPVAAPLAV